MEARRCNADRMERKKYTWRVARDTFDDLKRLVCGAGLQKADHLLRIDYYYDTDRQHFHQKGLTIRIRQQEGQLSGSLCRNFPDGRRLERPLPIARLPYELFLDGERLTCQGQMVTQRTTAVLSPGITLLLDRNGYCGKTDHELTLLAAPERFQRAEEWRETLDDYLARTTDAGCAWERSHKNKSDRLFDEKNALLLQKNKLICERWGVYDDLLRG